MISCSLQELTNELSQCTRIKIEQPFQSSSFPARQNGTAML